MLQYALEQYTNADGRDIPESVIEAFVVKIVAKRDGFDWYLRFDGDPNDPLHMKTEGKRRKNSSVSVVGGKLPTKQNCDTYGCYFYIQNNLQKRPCRISPARSNFISVKLYCFRAIPFITKEAKPFIILEKVQKIEILSSFRS